MDNRLMKKLFPLFLALVLANSIVFSAFASEESEERSLVFMLGGAAERSVSGVSINTGPTVAAEFMAIEDWLEIEIGTQYLSSTYPHALGGQILFKKPFEVAHNIELMVGAGPAMKHATSGVDQINRYAISFAADLMVWTSKNIGWFIGPEYSYGVGTSSERSVGLSVGLLFGL
jgi:hypothetical protein